MKIISSCTLSDDLLRQLKSEFPDYMYAKNIDDIAKHELKDVVVQVTYGHDITAERLDEMKSLKLIHVMQSGLNLVPFDELIKRDIMLTNSKGINSITIAEYTMGMMLNLIRNSFVYYDAQKKNQWDFTTTLDELYGKTLGILGYGSIGTELAKRAKAFGMRVLASKRRYAEEIENVDEVIKTEDRMRIFKEADFIVSLLPLTPDTEGMIGEKELAMMKSTASLINVSRSGIVDLEALIDSLESEKIRAAVLDVFDVEPLPEDSELWNVKNLYLTPHIAGDRHPAYKQRAFDILFHNLKKVSANEFNEMKNIVDKTQGY